MDSGQMQTVRNHGLTWIEWLVTISIIALIVGILLPAVNTGCGPSPAVYDLSQLRQIGVGLVAYSFDNDDILPSDPKEIANYLGSDPGAVSILTNPYHEISDRAELTELVKRVDPASGAIRYGGYVFVELGSAMNEFENPKEVALAYTAKVSDKQVKRNVVFADGHAEQCEEEHFRAVLVPGVDVDALDGL